MITFEDDKYIIIKKSDLEEFLTDDEISNIELYLNTILLKKNLTNHHKYYVCNRDEPYAKDVIMLIMKGEMDKKVI